MSTNTAIIIDKPARSRKARAPKSVQIVARVTVKSDSRFVVYICRSSNGVDTYQTTLFNGHATACECKSHRPCYHMTGCEKLESERTEQLAEAAIVEAVLLPEMVASGDVEAHVADSIEHGDMEIDPWSDPEYNPFAGMTEDEKRTARYWMFENNEAA